MEENKYNSQAIASLVLGILALIWGFFLIGGALVATILGIIAIVLGILAIRKKGRGYGMAIVGIVCGGICILLTVFVIAASLS